jgi:hypothetical protein
VRAPKEREFLFFVIILPLGKSENWMYLGFEFEWFSRLITLLYSSFDSIFSQSRLLQWM